MKYIIDTELLDAEGFYNVIDIIECYGEPIEDSDERKEIN